MIDIIAIAAVLLIVGGAVGYIVWAKKRGRHCIGCPDSKTCGGNCSSCAYRCASDEEKK